jgi:hypothetical protein
MSRLYTEIEAQIYGLPPFRVSASKQAEQALKHNGISRPKFDWMQWVNSSPINQFIASLFIMLGLLASVFAVGPYLNQFSRVLIDLDKLVNTVVAAWQVLATLTGLTFVLAMLMFERAMGDQYAVTHQFIRRSIIGLVLMSTLLTIIGMLLVPVVNSIPWLKSLVLPLSIWALVLFVFDTFLIIKVLEQVYQFLQPTYRNTFRIFALGQTLSDALYRQIHIRIANNFIKAYCNEIGIFWGSVPGLLTQQQANQLEPLELSLLKGYEVTDINLRILERVAKKISLIESVSSQKVGLHLSYYFGFGNKFRDKYIIAYIPSSATNIGKLLKYAVRTGKHTDSSIDSLDLFLSGIRQELMAAINDNNIVIVESVTHLYGQYFEILAGYFQNSSIQITPQDIPFELVGWGDSLGQVERIRQDIYETTHFAYSNTQNLEILKELTYLPFHLCRIAIKHHDKLVFQAFIEMIEWLYRSGFQITDTSTRAMIHDTILRMLCDSILDGQIWRQLTDISLSANEQDIFVEYAKATIQILYKLAQAALIHRDEKTFKNALLALFQIIKPLMDDADESKLYGVRHFGDSIDADKLRTLKIIEHIENDLLSIRNVILFGISAQIYYLIQSNNATSLELRPYFDAIRFSDYELDERYQDYRNALHDRFDEILRLTSLELSEHIPPFMAASTAYSLNHNGWLTAAYCLFALQLGYANLSPVDGIVGNSAVVIKSLEEMKSDERWESLLNINHDEYIRRIEMLIEVHQIAADQQKQIEEERLIAGDLDINKITEFREKATETWSGKTIVKEIIKKLGTYQECTNCEIPVHVQAFGVWNHPHQKEAFVQDSNYGGWGQQYGEQMARGEDEQVLEMLINQGERSVVTEKELLGKIEQTLDHMKHAGYEPAILFVGHSLLGHRLKVNALGLNSYALSWTHGSRYSSMAGYQGSFKECPAFQLYSSAFRGVILVDLKKLGELIQYPANEVGDYPLSISVQPIDEKRANEIIDQQPGKHLKVDGKQVERKEGVQLLQQRVLISISERIEFRIQDGSARTILSLEK